MANGKPSASIDTLQRRGEILSQIRQFFSERGVLEVETPLICPTTATDPHLESIKVVQVFAKDSRDYFLQTSPEFAMKKLLAAGSGSIYQLCKAFRQGERSQRHNPEFTMLEWYRVDFDEHQLIDEVEKLVNTITGRKAISRISYRDLFLQHLNLDPHSCSDEALRQQAKKQIEFNESLYTRDHLLHLLLAEVIEPAMEDAFVYDFPACLSALAIVEPDEHGIEVAKRFELFINGMEIANGYKELIDPIEQRQRFEQDNQTRRDMNLPELPIDQALIEALENGLPTCAGVALGIDRLVMLALGANSIDEVIGFPVWGH